MPKREGFIQVAFTLREGSKLANFVSSLVQEPTDDPENASKSIHDVCRKLVGIGALCLKEHQSECTEKPVSREQQLALMKVSYCQICS